MEIDDLNESFFFQNQSIEACINNGKKKKNQQNNKPSQSSSKSSDSIDMKSLVFLSCNARKINDFASKVCNVISVINKEN